jgi:DNA repair exonuclease SbcCD ATPase subunit
MSKSQSKGGLTSAQSEQMPDIPSDLSENIVSITSPELFWRAKYLRKSDVLGHLPFLFWLVSNLRPLRTVTLNTGAGVAHFAACQAIEKVGIDALCHGFGSWDDAGVPKDMAEYNADQYEEFSNLTEAKPAKALRHVKKDSIDLLIVEGPLKADVLDTVLKDWPTRMTSRGIVVFSGLESASDEDAERLDTWCVGKPTVGFSHSGGLRVIALGDEVPEQALRFSRLDENSAAFMTIERIFSRMGAMHLNGFQAHDKGQWARKLSEKLDEIEMSKAALVSEHTTQSEKLKTLQEAYDARQKRAAQSEAELYDTKTALDALKHDTDGHLKTAVANAVKLEKNLTVTATQRDQLTDELKTTQAAMRAVAESAQEDHAAFEALRLEFDEHLKKSTHAENDHRTTLADLTQERDALADRLQATEQLTTKAEQTVESERSTIRDLLAELEKARETTIAEQNDFKLEMQQTHAEQDALKAEIRATETELEHMRSMQADVAQKARLDIATLMQTLAIRDEDIRRLEIQNAAANDRLCGLETQIAEAATEQDTEILTLTDMLDNETGQRIALSEECAALKRTAANDVARGIEEIGSLTSTLTLALECSEERSIARSDDIKTLELKAKNDLAAAEEERDALDQRLTNALESLDFQAEKAQSRIDSLQAELAKTRLTRDTEEARQMTASKEKARILKMHEVAETDLTQQINVAQRKARAQDKTISTLREQLDCLKEHAKALETAWEDLKGSTSWRVTAPLRQATSALRKRK